jgi:hypothetical protein
MSVSVSASAWSDSDSVVLGDSSIKEAYLGRMKIFKLVEAIHPISNHLIACLKIQRQYVTLIVDLVIGRIEVKYRS